MTGRHFALRYGTLRSLLSLLGLGPTFSSVDFDERELRVRMGWAFRTTVPRSSITAAVRDRDMWWGIGVHGWAGRWLVNGSVAGIVTIRIEPPGRAWVLGWPVRLRELSVSLVDP